MADISMLLFPALFLLVKNVFQTATHDGRGFEVLFQCIQFVLLAVKFFLKTSLICSHLDATLSMPFYEHMSISERLDGDLVFIS